MKKILFLTFAFFLKIYFVNAQLGPCIDSVQLVTVPPMSPNSTYTNGTTVTFCLTVYGYQQTSADWLCGIVPTFGPGWDTSTLMPTSLPPSVSANGDWGWYSTCTSTNSGMTFGPGFFFDTGAGNSAGVQDSVPGNNYGDNCGSLTCTWTFCFSIAVNDCQVSPNGTSLSVSIGLYGDDIAGSWGSSGCVDPPALLLDSVGNFPTTFCNCVLTVPTLNIVNETCAGNNDGSATAIPATGYPPYTYAWSNGQTTQTATGLGAGIYTVSVTDSALCVKTIIFQVLSSPVINHALTVNQPGCNGGTTGSATMNASGGTGQLTYQWSPTGGNGPTANNLAPGNYTITVTDSLGCSITDSITIYLAPPLSISTSSTPASCGTNNGSAFVTINSGTSPYSYSWLPNGGNGPTANNLLPGTYFITVMDSNGCTQTDSVYVNAIGTFTLATTSSLANCAGTGGSASVTVTGTTGPYTYNWQPSGGNSSTATNLNSGNYTVFVTDTANCVITANVSVGQISNTVSVTTSVTQIGCNVSAGGSITANPTGGTGSYSYQWSPTGGNGQTATGLPAGSYTVQITDSNQCTATASAVINPYVAMSINVTSVPSPCTTTSGGSATAAVTDGTPTYSYSWSNGQTTATITNLVAGTYTVTVTDGNNCTITGNVTITQIPPVTVTASATNTAICNGQSTTLNTSVTGGTGTMSYNWSNGNINSSQTVSPGGNTTYTVTVTDVNSCSASAQVSVSVNPIPVINISTADDSICYGGNTILTATGANSFIWSPATGLSDTTVSNPGVTALNATTTYTVVGTSAGCSSSANITITVLPQVTASFSANPVSGTAPLTVAIHYTGSGANAYNWSYGNGNASFTGNDTSIIYTTGGTYYVTLSATNSFNCSSNYSVKIEVSELSGLEFPNVFTPNGDIKNDLFGPLYEDNVSAISVTIYNRWGEKVFDWNKVGGSWNGKDSNGKECPEGTYYYVVIAKGGVGAGAREYNLHGTVTLIR